MRCVLRMSQSTSILDIAGAVKEVAEVVTPIEAIAVGDHAFATEMRDCSPQGMQLARGGMGIVINDRQVVQFGAMVSLR